MTRSGRRHSGLLTVPPLPSSSLATSNHLSDTLSPLKPAASSQESSSAHESTAWTEGASCCNSTKTPVAGPVWKQSSLRRQSFGVAPLLPSLETPVVAAASASAAAATSSAASRQGRASLPPMPPKRLLSPTRGPSIPLLPSPCDSVTKKKNRRRLSASILPDCNPRLLREITNKDGAIPPADTVPSSDSTAFAEVATPRLPRRRSLSDVTHQKSSSSSERHAKRSRILVAEPDEASDDVSPLVFAQTPVSTKSGKRRQSLILPHDPGEEETTVDMVESLAKVQSPALSVQDTPPPLLPAPLQTSFQDLADQLAQARQLVHSYTDRSAADRQTAPELAVLAQQTQYVLTPPVLPNDHDATTAAAQQPLEQQVQRQEQLHRRWTVLQELGPNLRRMDQAKVQASAQAANVTGVQVHKRPGCRQSYWHVATARTISAAAYEEAYTTMLTEMTMVRGPVWERHFAAWQQHDVMLQEDHVGKALEAIEASGTKSSPQATGSSPDDTAPSLPNKGTSPDESTFSEELVDWLEELDPDDEWPETNVTRAPAVKQDGDDTNKSLVLEDDEDVTNDSHDETDNLHNVTNDDDNSKALPLREEPSMDPEIRQAEQRLWHKMDEALREYSQEIWNIHSRRQRLEHA